MLDSAQRSMYRDVMLKKLYKSHSGIISIIQACDLPVGSRRHKNCDGRIPQGTCSDWEIQFKTKESASNQNIFG